MNSNPAQPLVFLDHAKERMSQREISPEEVQEILTAGTPSEAGKLSRTFSVSGQTAAGRPIKVTRRADSGVVVSAVSLEGPTQ